MTYWRSAGITYLRFSSIAARTVRRALKTDVKADPIRETFTIKKVEAKTATPPK